MTDAVTNELMYEVLKKIQADVGDIRTRITDVEEQMKGIRHVLIAMQSDDLRHEAVIAGLRVDMDKVRKRLDLTDA